MWNDFTHLYQEFTTSFTALHDYHTPHSRSYPFRLQHHHTAKYAVRFVNVHHAKKESIQENELSVFITVLHTISLVQLLIGKPRNIPDTRYCTKTAPTNHRDRQWRSTRLGYLIERLGSGINLTGATHLQVGHVSKQKYMYVDVKLLAWFFDTVLRIFTNLNFAEDLCKW